MDSNKKIYISLFLLLILPAIFVRLGVESGEVFLSGDTASALTSFFKIGIILLTIWYALKIEIKGVWSVVLGLSTLFPLMTWISFVILLLKSPNREDSLKNKQGENSYKNIKNELEKEYIPLFEEIMQMPHSKAREFFEDTYNKIVKESNEEKSEDLPENYGDFLLENEDADKKIKVMLSDKRKEEVTDDDIRWWWNMHDYERRMMLKIDEINRTSLFVSELKDGKSQENATQKVFKFHPIFGNVKEKNEVNKENKPLPCELKDRVNLYISNQIKNNPSKYKEKIESYSTFNSLIRDEIKKGNL